MASCCQVDRALAYAMTGRAAEAILLVDAWLASAHRRHMTMAPVAAETFLLLGRLDRAHEVVLATPAQLQAQRERGHEARMLWLLGEIAARRDPTDLVDSERHYAAALVLVEELETRPLKARCRLGLGKLYRRVGRLAEARSELATAIEMFREIGMTFWLPEAEAELARCNEPMPSTSA